MEASNGFAPLFFVSEDLQNHNFTDNDTGKVLPTANDSFDRLKTFIQKGSGEDARGIKWELVTEEKTHSG